jgi:hypothetical protein
VADGVDATAGKGEKGWRGTAYEETQDLMEEVSASFASIKIHGSFPAVVVS